MADTLLKGTTLIEDKRTGSSLVWSCSGAAFHARSPDIDDIRISGGGLGEAVTTGNTISLIASVNLPDGATVTSIVVHGDAAAEAGETYTFSRVNMVAATASDLVSTTSIGTEATSISNAIIDNSTFGYFIQTSTMDAADTLHGAIIKYTL